MAYLGEEIKKLGFGTMRLPMKGDAIDIGQTKTMVDAFLSAGGTYFDTAWAYDGSEEALKEALVDRYPRESYQLATKMAAWMGCQSRADATAQFDASLARTGAGYFDFYLLHNVGESRTHFYDDFGLWDFLSEKKEEGLIRHIGFSFHSTPEELEAVLTKHTEMEFVQLQINYADWETPGIQAKACYEVARRHGKPVIIMEPVKGGMLANPPQEVREILTAADPNRSYASWALRFAASLPGVITVLSGMSSEAQMQDNLDTLMDFTGMTKAENEVIEKARAAIESVPIIPCTNCNYCAKVCPENIGISGTFKAVNEGTLYGREAGVHEMDFLRNRFGKKGPEACRRCGACEQACPQHLPIRAELAKAAKIY